MLYGGKDTTTSLTGLPNRVYFASLHSSPPLKYSFVSTSFLHIETYLLDGCLELGQGVRPILSSCLGLLHYPIMKDFKCGRDSLILDMSRRGPPYSDHIGVSMDLPLYVLIHLESKSVEPRDTGPMPCHESGPGPLFSIFSTLQKTCVEVRAPGLWG